MSINLPEPYVGLTGVERPALIEHAEQVQRNFEKIARDWTQAPVDTVHAIGAAGEPAFAGTWANFDARVVCFWRDGAMVHLRGLAAGGVVGTAIFTLPVGYRPSVAGAVFQPVISNGALGGVVVDSAGVVTLLIGSNVYADLSPVHFRVA